MFGIDLFNTFGLALSFATTGRESKTRIKLVFIVIEIIESDISLVLVSNDSANRTFTIRDKAFACIDAGGNFHHTVITEILGIAGNSTNVANSIGIYIDSAEAVLHGTATNIAHNSAHSLAIAASGNLTRGVAALD